MKCEKCAGELPDKKVICPQCGFNNALQNWRQRKAQAAAQREQQPTEKPDLTARPASPLAAKVRARYTAEANLIHYPFAPEPAEEATPAAVPSEPAWRAQTKERVREHLERRKTEAEGDSGLPANPDDPTKQLLVESALKRIRRTPPPAPALPPAFRSGGKAQALARALDYEEQVAETAPPETDPVSEPVHSPRAVSLPAPPLLQLNLSAAQLAEPASTDVPASTHVVTGNVMAETAPAVDDSLLAEALDLTEPAADEGEALPDLLELQVDEDNKANLWIGKPAPIWLRTLAGAVDLEAAALAYLPFFAVYTSLDGPPESADFYVMAAMLAVVVYFYQLITYSFNGRTVGMAIWGLRCAALEEASQPVSFKRRLWQALGGTVALLCPPFNFLITRFTEYQRGLADALAGTITLRRVRD